MVAKDFIDLFNSLVYSQRIAIEDYADRMNLFTVILMLICCVIISAKQYFLNPMSCYIPVSPSGNSFDKYVSDYCWVHGTIPLAFGEAMPKDSSQWLEYDHYRRISYYQWVPFVLGLQCIFFYLPHIAWRAVCTYRSEGDLFGLVQAAAGAATAGRSDRSKTVTRVVEFLEDLLEGHSDVRRGRRHRLAQRAYSSCGLCVASKRLGTCLVFSYIAFKVLTIVNGLIQLWLIQQFLGFHSTGSHGAKSLQLGKNPADDAVEHIQTGFGFGITVLNHITRGFDWPETMMFPRVTYCFIQKIRLVGVNNDYTAQCALPINMLNEKFYIFFWFWILLLVVVCITSLVFWLYRMVFASGRKDFVKRFLRVRGISSHMGGRITREDVEEFVDDYLRRDGAFLVHMLAMNAGEVITSEIVTMLYKNYMSRQEPSTPDKGSTEKEPPSFV